MDRRRFIKGAMGAAGGFALASCGTQNTFRRSARTALLPAGELESSSRLVLKLSGSDYGGLSPVSYFPPAYERSSYIFDSLLWHDSTGKVLPWLASSHQASPDGLKHSFQLRPKVKWHDGRSFGADDVAFSFEYASGKSGLGAMAPWSIFGPKHVETVKTTGDSSVEITLDKPAATFVDQVAARFLIFPRHLYSRPGQDSSSDQSLWVGTGPYVFKSYGGGGRGGYLFEANDGFFLGRPYVRRLELHAVSDELLALKSGQIDAGGLEVRPTSSDVLAAFRSDPAFAIIEGPYDFLTALHFNLEEEGPLSDVRFRKAMAYAIDREDIVKRLLGGMGAPGNPGFLAPGNSFTVSVEQYGFNRSKAERLLDEAGYRKSPNGARLGSDGKPLSFTVKGLAESSQAFELIARALKRIGIELTYQPVEQLFQGLNEYEMALVVYGGVSEDPDFMRTVFSSRTKEKMFFGAKGYSNAEFDDLADRQLVSLDKSARKDLVAQMQRIVAADLPLLHLYYPRPFLVYRKSKFDQWAWNPRGMGPFNKQALVTGVGTGGTAIRPTK